MSSGWALSRVHDDILDLPYQIRVFWTKIFLILYLSVGNLITNITMLQRHKPLIKVMEFVGQSGGTSGKKGLTQKEQIEVVRRFKEGGFNTLVATCVGEEGLDIGEVDLIVCYDVSKSPIRYLPY